MVDYDVVQIDNKGNISAEAITPLTVTNEIVDKMSDWINKEYVRQTILGVLLKYM